MRVKMPRRALSCRCKIDFAESCVQASGVVLSSPGCPSGRRRDQGVRHGRRSGERSGWGDGLIVASSWLPRTRFRPSLTEGRSPEGDWGPA